MSKEHELKCWPEFYRHLVSGEKTFEARKDDRGFHAGDVLRLREWSKEGGYTGREMRRTVTYVLGGLPYLQPGYVVMGLSRGYEASNEEPIGFGIEERAGVKILFWDTGGCRPASDAEVKLFEALKKRQTAPQGELSEEQRIAWQLDVDELAAARQEADRYRRERDEARAARAAPTGWKLVPIEPPQEILDALEDIGTPAIPNVEQMAWQDYQRERWKQILAVVPSAPEYVPNTAPTHRNVTIPPVPSCIFRHGCASPQKCAHAERCCGRDISTGAQNER